VHDQPVVGRTCKVNRRQSAIATGEREARVRQALFQAT
jgi:hypothetical protein